MNGPFSSRSAVLLARAQHEAALSNSYSAALHYVRERDEVGFARELLWLQVEVDCIAAVDVLAALPQLFALAASAAHAEAA